MVRVVIRLVLNMKIDHREMRGVDGRQRQMCMKDSVWEDQVCCLAQLTRRTLAHSGVRCDEAVVVERAGPCPRLQDLTHGATDARHQLGEVHLPICREEASVLVRGLQADLVSEERVCVQRL